MRFKYNGVLYNLNSFSRIGLVPYGLNDYRVYGYHDTSMLPLCDSGSKVEAQKVLDDIETRINHM